MLVLLSMGVKICSRNKLTVLHVREIWTKKKVQAVLPFCWRNPKRIMFTKWVLTLNFLFDFYCRKWYLLVFYGPNTSYCFVAALIIGILKNSASCHIDLLLFLFQHVFIHVVASFSFILAATCFFSTTRRLACIWKCKILIPNLVCVNVLQIEVKKFGMLSNWQREFTMEDILTQLRKEMAAPYNRKLVQPPEGTFFWVDKLKKGEGDGNLKKMQM